MIEGKLANRSDVKGMKGSALHVRCEKCNVIMHKPETILIGNKKIGFFVCQSYLSEKNYVYESKSGYAVCYCSKYCAKKHNHRFKKN